MSKAASSPNGSQVRKHLVEIPKRLAGKPHELTKWCYKTARKIMKRKGRLVETIAGGVIHDLPGGGLFFARPGTTVEDLAAELASREPKFV